MKFNNLILIAILLSLAIFQITTISLITKYQTQDSKIMEIISNLNKAEKSWKYPNFSISNQTKSISTQHSIEELNLYNFNYTSSFLTTSELKGKFVLKEDNINNTLEITSSNDKESPYDLTIEFSFDYSNDFRNTTNLTSSGKGQFFLKSQSFNYTAVFAHPEYEVLNLVEVGLTCLEVVSDDDAHGRVAPLLIEALEEGLLAIISTDISEELASSLDEFEIKKENEKNFVLTSNYYPEKVYTISYRESLAYKFDLIGVINFMEGSIEGEKVLSDEDTEIPAFSLFDFEMQTDQVFLHKKLFVDIFKLGLENQLETVTTDEAKQLKIKGLNNMNLKWLSLYYPEVLHFKPIDTEFYIEYFVNSVTYKNSNALVDYSFFFIAEDEEVLIKLNLSYNFIFELIDDINAESGKRSLNFVIRDSASLVQRDFRVLSPQGPKVDKKKLSMFVNDLLVARYRKNNYRLLKDFEDFGKLIQKFDTIKPLEDGLILYQRPVANQETMKFLFSY